ncbi:hypothetical protein LCGC14_2260880 [marine sediment metagenome]|uniref:Uncharacterized protein n=1 Tax=marine sediment metagenome TaxID=412755 RepID=A0A0F9FUS9_9ZZZZ
MIIVVGLIANNLMVKDRRVKINQTETTRQNQINCVLDVTKTADQRWQNECNYRGWGYNCRLPNSVANRFQKLYVSDKITCQEAFK